MRIDSDLQISSSIVYHKYRDNLWDWVEIATGKLFGHPVYLLVSLRNVWNLFSKFVLYKNEQGFCGILLGFPENNVSALVTLFSLYIFMYLL